MLDERIKVGTRVLVTMDWDNQKGFSGHTAVVERIGGNPVFPLLLTFDDSNTEYRNSFSWSPTQVVYLEDQKYVR